MLIRDRRVEAEPPVNLMPLLDMVFLLLIFFLVATTFAREERDISVELPAASLAQPLSAPPQEVIVNVRADGTFVVATEEVPPAELREMLARVARDEPDREVLIRADERSLHRYFAAVARICREAGIDKAKIGYLLEPARAAGE
jgi:biopolymer transport protein ExbD